MLAEELKARPAKEAHPGIRVRSRSCCRRLRGSAGEHGLLTTARPAVINAKGLSTSRPPPPWGKTHHSGGRLEADRHRLDAVDEVRAEVPNLAVELDAAEAAQQLTEHRPQLEPRQARAQAEMLADAERQVLVGRARDVEAVGIRKDILVAIA